MNTSTSPNVLDDYEEGTFTPGIAFGGGTSGLAHAVQIGGYTKIGNLVCVHTCNLALSAKGASTGQATITGLPFPPSSGRWDGDRLLRQFRGAGRRADLARGRQRVGAAHVSYRRRERRVADRGQFHRQQPVSCELRLSYRVRPITPARRAIRRVRLWRAIRRNRVSAGLSADHVMFRSTPIANSTIVSA